MTHGCALAGPAEIRAGAWKIAGNSKMARKFPNSLSPWGAAARRQARRTRRISSIARLDSEIHANFGRCLRGIRVSDGGRGGRDQGPGARPAYEGWGRQATRPIVIDPGCQGRQALHQGHAHPGRGDPASGRQRSEQRANPCGFFAKCAQLSRQMQVTAGAPNFGDLSLASGIGRIVLHANYCAR